jgi:hypothetical protein
MKRVIVRTLALTTVTGILGMFASGCADRVVVHERVATPPPGEVVVTTEPPALRHEVVPVAPSERHVWTEGYWARSHGHWVWVPGRYEVRPREHAVWVKGHWDRTDRGWVWVAGHWA